MYMQSLVDNYGKIRCRINESAQAENALTCFKLIRQLATWFSALCQPEQEQ